MDGWINSLDVGNSIFNVNEENINFEFFTDTLNELSFEELKDELEEILYISDFTPSQRQHQKKDSVF